MAALALRNAAVGASLARFTGRAMGSPLRLAVPSGAPGERAWAEVLDEFEACERAMSRFRDTSEVSRLNRRAGVALPMAVSRRLEQALVTADRARRVTGGRFEPRVLRALEALGDRGATIPARSSEGRPGGGRVVDREPDGRVQLDAPVDLGGIGKGLALRWAAGRVRSLGIEAFLLEAGGDLVAAGSPPPAEPGTAAPWQVGIEDPEGGAAPLAVIGVRDRAVATSSTRLRRWSHAGRAVHHLIDPTTGEPGGARLVAVTVQASDPAWAEVWSKALFLEGRDGIGPRARQAGLAAWWVTDEARLEMTPAARPATTWVRDSAG